ncbi:non-ribosomal peptide synthetase, partial [Bacillus sp. 196mf]|uniref:non-ribosomal peptide synthetase n=1 Tax=Bacillus sp. 196mf TaxID=1761754 RepID=UPI00115848C9
VDRSLEMIVGLLGILKAGGAYVPLDPSYPEERLNYILNDANLNIILSKNNTIEWTAKDIKNINLDKNKEEISKECMDNPSITIKLDNLAYVIYTSGSTGNPKGVLLEHKGVCNLIATTINIMQIDSMSRVIQFASVSFDASVFEIFPSLIAGATLYISNKEGIMPGKPLTTFLQNYKITHATLPPTVLNILDESKFKNLKVIVSAGSACSEHIAQRWSKNFLFINGYGPTEATVCATAGVYDGYGEPHIGHPIPNVEVYILDQNQQPVTAGGVGELYIGGIGVARGYLNRPELTKKSFISNPFKEDSSVKLYRTGDLVKHLLDGNIEYIDRMDNQVKVRGFRIELGEIEAVLGKNPSIREVAVVAQDDTFGDKQLIAYVAGEGSIQNWREYITEKLPNYMVPAHFIKLDALPLTINGKVDTKSLPKWEHSIQNIKQYVPPRNEIEKKLVEIWSEVLGINQPMIGVQDNFFELGGHSLLATKIIVRVQENLNIRLPVGAIFKHPDIECLSKKIEMKSQLKKEDTLPVLKATERNEYEQLSYAQQRLWFIDKMETNSSLYNIPLAWRLKGQYNIDSLTKAFNQLIQRHEILRTVFKEINGKPMQLIQDNQEHLLPVVDLRHLSQEEKNIEIAKQEKIDVDQPFNLRQGPLIRAYLLLMENDELVIHCTIHHIIFDGWSLNIFIDEWMNLYQAHLKNKDISLPPLPIQYTDFANWQRNTLQGARLNKQLEYWKQELNGPIPVLQLPLDFPRPAIQTYNGSTHQFILPKTLLNKIKSFSHKESVTLFAVLLASYQGFLFRYTGQKEILIGSPIANRHYPEIEGLIGFFVNTLIYRARCTNNTTFNELVKQVNEKIIEAQDHQDVPFEKIVEAVKPERNASYSPLFQTMFVLQSQSRKLPGVLDHQLEKLPRSMNGSKFDLTVTMEEVEKELQVEFEYNTDLFHASTIERMVQNFETWLNEVIDFPEEHIGNLRLVSRTEERQLLREWTSTTVEYPKESVIQELFEQQVVKSPNGVAVVYKDQQLTYRE